MVKSYRTSYLCLRSRHLSGKSGFPVTNTRPTGRHYDSVKVTSLVTKRSVKFLWILSLLLSLFCWWNFPQSSGHKGGAKPVNLHLRIGMAGWRLCLLWEAGWAIFSLHFPRTRRLQTCGTFKETCKALGYCVFLLWFSVKHSILIPPSYFEHPTNDVVCFPENFSNKE